jgi:hypothetical protein
VGNLFLFVNSGPGSVGEFVYGSAPLVVSSNVVGIGSVLVNDMDADGVQDVVFIDGQRLGWFRGTGSAASGYFNSTPTVIVLVARYRRAPGRRCCGAVLTWRVCASCAFGSAWLPRLDRVTTPFVLLAVAHNYTAECRSRGWRRWETPPSQWRPQRGPLCSPNKEAPTGPPCRRCWCRTRLPGSFKPLRGISITTACWYVLPCSVCACGGV